jgi:hypothetical protein
METADKLFEQAKRLKRGELSRLVALLQDYLESAEESSDGTRSYVRTLALSGTAQSDWTDVSSQKGKHLARAYATRRG